METVKVLLADSDARRSVGISNDLRQNGIEVVSTNDAVHTLGLARQARPDVLMVSSQLAGGSLAALQRLRSNVYTAAIPVIAILAGKSITPRQFLDAGAQACIEYPVPAEKLLAAIRQHTLQSLDFTEAPAAVLSEPSRLEALHETGLLDSPAEAAFDRLTRVATRVLGVPTALVTLVDKDRQFFKSQIGLPQPWAGERQTRLSHSFCQWVVAGKEPVVIEDAREHPVLRSNLAIRDLGVTAYAGVPIEGRNGEAIGSMCAIDSSPRSWSPQALETLGDLGRIVEAYAALQSAKRRGGGNLETSLLIGGLAIQGAARILRRHGDAAAASERDELLAIIEEQGGHLLSLAGRKA